MSDLISRHDAATIPVMPKEHRQYQTMNIDDAYELGWYDLQDCIESLPSADRPTGEWVHKYDKHINCYWYECNQCGEYRPRNVFGKEWSSPYCPNCGAYMKGNEL